MSESQHDPAALFKELEGSRGLLLAVSGGPDSLALMILIDEWRKNYTRNCARNDALTNNTARPPVFVATVDHGLRASSRAEAEAVSVWARTRSLPHTILDWIGPKPATGMPAAARKIRYSLLARHADEIGCDTIVTGHHANDQAETVLMRLLRGSGPAGLAGMAERAAVPGAAESSASNLILARPLLGLDKAALHAICAAHSQASFEDATNSDMRFRRPQLRAIASDLEKQGLTPAGLNRLARRAARANAALDQYARERLAVLPAHRTEAGFSISRTDMDAIPDELMLRLMQQEIARLAPRSVARLEQLEEALAGVRTRGVFVKSLAGVVIRANAATLNLTLEPPRKPAPKPPH